MIILGIETTCDETGVGIVRDGREILANVVASSADMHKKFGGIVPEVAAREQINSIIPVISQTVYDAAQISNFQFPISNQLSSNQLLNWIRSNIDAVAVAYGPGLVGSLLIGVETAKTLALVFGKPLIGVNHLIGHVYANWVEVTDVSNASKVSKVKRIIPEFPLVALIVSGGHTDLILMTGHNKYRWLGGTRDDAAGEVFDKVARVLGLGYPGGPEVEKIASNFQTRNLKLPYRVNETRNIKFPRPMIGEDNFDFSFSGLKTAVVNLVNRSSMIVDPEEIAYEFQEAVVGVLVKKTFKAAKKYGAKNIVVGGGVAANNFLREEFRVKSLELKVPTFFPTKGMSVDNGAMIATAAYFQKNSIDPLKLSANPGLNF